MRASPLAGDSSPASFYCYTCLDDHKPTTLLGPHKAAHLTVVLMHLAACSMFPGIFVRACMHLILCTMVMYLLQVPECEEALAPSPRPSQGALHHCPGKCPTYTCSLGCHAIGILYLSLTGPDEISTCHPPGTLHMVDNAGTLKVSPSMLHLTQHTPVAFEASLV
jgi:hypothetical protein